MICKINDLLNIEIKLETDFKLIQTDVRFNILDKYHELDEENQNNN
jgi:hypothetical protein